MARHLYFYMFSFRSIRSSFSLLILTKCTGIFVWQQNSSHKFFLSRLIHIDSPNSILLRYISNTNTSTSTSTQAYTWKNGIQNRNHTPYKLLIATWIFKCTQINVKILMIRSLWLGLWYEWHGARWANERKIIASDVLLLVPCFAQKNLHSVLLTHEEKVVAFIHFAIYLYVHIVCRWFVHIKCRICVEILVAFSLSHFFLLRKLFCHMNQIIRFIKCNWHKFHDEC